MVSVANEFQQQIRFPVDLELFDRCKHSPSIASLQHSMNRPRLSIVDYCIPVNLYFPPPQVIDWLAQQLGNVLKFYPEQNDTIARNFSRSIGLSNDNVVMANGSTELIAWIVQLFVQDVLLTPVPTFGRWTDYPIENGKQVVYYHRREQNGFAIDVGDFLRDVKKSSARAVAICNPNNPTGNLTDESTLHRLLDGLSHLDVVVIDESFLDFADGDKLPSMAQEAIQRPNVIVIKSLGKNYGLHGMRAGYAVTNRRWAAQLAGAMPAWNVNAIAETLIGRFVNFRTEYEASRRRTIEDRRYQQRELEKLPGFQVYDSNANFVYVRVPDGVSGIQLRNRLLTRHGCLLRECGNKVGADSRYFRIATRSSAQVQSLCQAIGDSLQDLPSN